MQIQLNQWMQEIYESIFQVKNPLSCVGIRNVYFLNIFEQKSFQSTNQTNCNKIGNEVGAYKTIAINFVENVLSG